LGTGGGSGGGDTNPLYEGDHNHGSGPECTGVSRQGGGGQARGASAPSLKETNSIEVATTSEVVKIRGFERPKETGARHIGGKNLTVPQGGGLV